MKTSKMADAIGEVNEKYITEAVSYKANKKTMYAAVATVAALAVINVQDLARFENRDNTIVIDCANFAGTIMASAMKNAEALNKYRMGILDNKDKQIEINQQNADSRAIQADAAKTRADILNTFFFIIHPPF